MKEWLLPTSKQLLSNAVKNIQALNNADAEA
jgi:hypothetical protein